MSRLCIADSRYIWHKTVSLCILFYTHVIMHMICDLCSLLQVEIMMALEEKFDLTLDEEGKSLFELRWTLVP